MDENMDDAAMDEAQVQASDAIPIRPRTLSISYSTDSSASSGAPSWLHSLADTPLIYHKYLAFTTEERLAALHELGEEIAVILADPFTFRARLREAQPAPVVGSSVAKVPDDIAPPEKKPKQVFYSSQKIYRLVWQSTLHDDTENALGDQTRERSIDRGKVAKEGVISLKETVAKIQTWFNIFKAASNSSNVPAPTSDEDGDARMDSFVDLDFAGTSLPWAAIRSILKTLRINEDALKERLTSVLFVVEGVEHVARMVAKATVLRVLLADRDEAIEEKVLNLVEEIQTVCLRHLGHVRTLLDRATGPGDVAGGVEIVSNTDVKALGDALVEIEALDNELAQLTKSNPPSFWPEKMDTKAAMRIHLEQIDGLYCRRTNELRNLNDKFDEVQRKTMLDMISTEPYLEHHRQACLLQGHRDPAWIFDHPTFKKWHNESTPSILWLEGKRAAENTRIMSRIIQNAIDDHAQGKSNRPGFFYCLQNNQEPARSDAESILGSLVRQLMSPFDDESILSQTLRIGEVGYEDLLEEIKRIGVIYIRSSFLQRLYWPYKNMTIFIDGLDECSDETQRNLIKGLSDAIWSGCLMKVIISSRERLKIAHDFKDCTHRKISSDEEGPEVIGTDSPMSWERILRKIPRGPGDRRLLMERCLAWLLHAKQPFTPEEFMTLVSISKKSRVLDISPASIIKACSGLVTYDEVLKIFRFTSVNARLAVANRHDFNPARLNAVITETCIKALACTFWNPHVEEYFKKLGFTSDFSCDQTTDLYLCLHTYAAKHWVEHCNLAGEEYRSNEYLQPLLRLMFNSPNTGVFEKWYDQLSLYYERCRSRVQFITVRSHLNGTKNQSDTQLASVDWKAEYRNIDWSIDINTWCTPLQLACTNNLSDIVQWIVNDDSISVEALNVSNSRSHNAVQTAIIKNSNAALEILAKSSRIEIKSSHLQNVHLPALDTLWSAGRIDQAMLKSILSVTSHSYEYGDIVNWVLDRIDSDTGLDMAWIRESTRGRASSILTNAVLQRQQDSVQDDEDLLESLLASTELDLTHLEKYFRKHPEIPITEELILKAQSRLTALFLFDKFEGEPSLDFVRRLNSRQQYRELLKRAVTRMRSLVLTPDRILFLFKDSEVSSRDNELLKAGFEIKIADILRVCEQLRLSTIVILFRHAIREAREDEINPETCRKVLEAIKNKGCKYDTNILRELMFRGFYDIPYDILKPSIEEHKGPEVLHPFLGGKERSKSRKISRGSSLSSDNELEKVTEAFPRVTDEIIGWALLSERASQMVPMLWRYKLKTLSDTLLEKVLVSPWARTTLKYLFTNSEVELKIDERMMEIFAEMAMEDFEQALKRGKDVEITARIIMCAAQSWDFSEKIDLMRRHCSGRLPITEEVKHAFVNSFANRHREEGERRMRWCGTWRYMPQPRDVFEFSSEGTKTMIEKFRPSLKSVKFFFDQPEVNIIINDDFILQCLPCPDQDLQWLMSQREGGLAVSKALLCKAADADEVNFQYLLSISLPQDSGSEDVVVAAAASRFKTCLPILFERLGPQIEVTEKTIVRAVNQSVSLHNLKALLRVLPTDFEITEDFVLPMLEAISETKLPGFAFPKFKILLDTLDALLQSGRPFPVTKRIFDSAIWPLQTDLTVLSASPSTSQLHGSEEVNSEANHSYLRWTTIQRGTEIPRIFGTLLEELGDDAISDDVALSVARLPCSAELFKKVLEKRSGSFNITEDLIVTLLKSSNDADETISLILDTQLQGFELTHAILETAQKWSRTDVLKLFEERLHHPIPQQWLLQAEFYEAVTLSDIKKVTDFLNKQYPETGEGGNTEDQHSGVRLDIDAANEYGWTPLHVAACMQEARMTCLLLAHGANPDLKTHEGRTVYEYAELLRGEAITAILDKYNDLKLEGPLPETKQEVEAWYEELTTSGFEKDNRERSHPLLRHPINRKGHPRVLAWYSRRWKRSSSSWNVASHKYYEDEDEDPYL